MTMILQDQIRDRIVLGTAGLAGIWGKVDKMDSIRAIHLALESGIHRFDTAPAYADAESLLGEALSTWNGITPLISTKVGKLKGDSPDALLLDYSQKGIRKSAEQSMRVLNREVLDLVFLHDPVFMKPEEIEPAIHELLLLKEEGKIRNIGIGGNFGSNFLPHAVSGSFTHFMGFNRYNILVQDAANEEFIPLKSVGVEIWQASPLYMGLLGRKYQEYFMEKPEWILASVMDKAQLLSDRCRAEAIDMTGLALNFVMRSKDVDRMVIGASTSQELMKTVEYLCSPSLQDEADRLLLTTYAGP
jgi:aryl-alcohol dehydrogenase-like predicted oxidoreductase